jgi:hypothetical protein
MAAAEQDKQPEQIDSHHNGEVAERRGDLPCNGSVARSVNIFPLLF